MKRILNFLAVIVLCLVLPGCSWMSKSGRQQMAYRHYVNKHIRERQRHIARAQKAALRDAKYAAPSEPKVSASAGPAVEPVRQTASEPVADPVMVSASKASEAEDTQVEP